MSTLGVERSPRSGVTKDQTTWAVLITRVVLNHGTGFKRLFHFPPLDMTENTLIGGVQ